MGSCSKVGSELLFWLSKYPAFELKTRIIRKREIADRSMYTTHAIHTIAIDGGVKAPKGSVTVRDVALLRKKVLYGEGRGGGEVSEV